MTNGEPDVIAKMIYACVYICAIAPEKLNMYINRLKYSRIEVLLLFLSLAFNLFFIYITLFLILFMFPYTLFLYCLCFVRDLGFLSDVYLLTYKQQYCDRSRCENASIKYRRRVYRRNRDLSNHSRGDNTQIQLCVIGVLL